MSLSNGAKFEIPPAKLAAYLWAASSQFENGGGPPTAEQIDAAYQKILARSEAAGAGSDAAKTRKRSEPSEDEAKGKVGKKARVDDGKEDKIVHKYELKLCDEDTQDKCANCGVVWGGWPAEVLALYMCCCGSKNCHRPAYCGNCKSAFMDFVHCESCNKVIGQVDQKESEWKGHRVMYKYEFMTEWDPMRICDDCLDLFGHTKMCQRCARIVLLPPADMTECPSECGGKLSL